MQRFEVLDGYVNVQAFHTRRLFPAARFGSVTVGWHSAEQEAPVAVQQLSVRYPTSEFIAAKSAA
jgi:hypothetical protein